MLFVVETREIRRREEDVFFVLSSHVMRRGVITSANCCNFRDSQALVKILEFGRITEQFGPECVAEVDLSSAILDQLQKQLIIAMKQWLIGSVESMVSIPLLHGTLSFGCCSNRPSVSSDKAALRILLLLGFAVQPEIHPAASLSCRKCGGALETPGHVFLQCRDVQTVAARDVLKESLLHDFGMTLRASVTAADVHLLLQELIFNLGTVAPVARFIYKVVRAWRFFGRRLPTMVSELAPDTDEEADFWDLETATATWSLEGWTWK
ncbi:hypothetical protein R3P38DRAFT_3355918 [Favolaschia claudopus]|uniref:Reverse transcriptase zinc-binding domain-containing protein n=1 Tax=Favolaschia claudopus TaxID=2862362 RepID=A0AAW0BGN1_9AGAR